MGGPQPSQEMISTHAWRSAPKLAPPSTPPCFLNHWVAGGGWQSMAARIESGAGVSEMSVAFRCLGEDMEEVFGLFTDGDSPYSPLPLLPSPYNSAPTSNKPAFPVSGPASNLFHSHTLTPSLLHSFTPSWLDMKARIRSFTFACLSLLRLCSGAPSRHAARQAGPRSAAAPGGASTSQR